LINIELQKMNITGTHCANKNCKRLPEYMVNILGSVYYIRVDTTVAVISMGSSNHGLIVDYYCRGCIDEVYQLLKSKLDVKLWSFQ
jgi:hypothetical protein